MHGWDFAEICPIHAFYGFDACSGQGQLFIAREIMEGKLAHSEGLMKLMHACTACGACDVNCKSVRDMELLETILALRHDGAEAGFVPEHLKAAAENVKATHNPCGLPHADRFAWVPEGYEDDPGAEVGLFVGCSVYRRPETALAAMKLLKAGGVRFRLLRDEWCCGLALWQGGLREAAEECVLHNIETIRASGVKTVVTACAECFGSFRAVYPRYAELPFETKHISEIAADLLREGRLRLRPLEKPLTVTYHDPCMLGRRSEPWVPWEGEIQSWGLHVPEKHWNRGEFGVYEPPREALRAIPGLTLVEMPRSREEAWCCGAHAAAVDPELTAFAAAERRREAASTGAEAIVSACPACREALGAEAEDALPYYDLTELRRQQLALPYNDQTELLAAQLDAGGKEGEA
jgi:Fe-S oxidoreductase